MRVEWHVEPATALYKRNSFFLDFGDALTPRDLPLDLWWTLVLLCLHSHWNLLRPCRIVLPVRMDGGEVEFWLRLLDIERLSLEKYRGTEELARTIEIECEEEHLAGGQLPPPVERYATAFSGGKESLLQTGLLSEISERPLLVNTHSPMPPTWDHSTQRRDKVLGAITERRNCELVVVESDLRSGWDNFYSQRLGYRQTGNEIADVHLYAANLLAASAARGIRDVFLGSEFEIQQGGEVWRGKPTSFFFMMSPVIMLSLNRLFRQHGLSYSSLLFPLSQYQDELLLWRRYGDLAELQNSCSEVRSEAESYCSQCLKCLKIAALLMALEIDPARVGLDATKMFTSGVTWDSRGPPTAGALAFAANQIDSQSARRFFPPQNIRQRIGLQEPPAYHAFIEFRARYRDAREDWVGEYRPSFMKYVSAPLKPRLDKIYREYFPVIDPVERNGEIELLDATVDWITEPLGSPDAVDKE